MTDDLFSDSVGATADVTATENEATAGSTSIEFDKYMDSLSDSHKELLSKNNVDSFDAQEKWISGLNSAIGKKGILPPSEDATDEEKAKFKEDIYDQLGRPKDGSYDFDLPEGSKDEYYTDDFLNGLAQVAHKYGMNQEGFQEMMSHIGQTFNSVVKEWEGQVSSIKEKLGEDKLDDSGAINKPVYSKATLHEQARTKAIEAQQQYLDGNYSVAEQLKREANELYNKYGQL